MLTEKHSHNPANNQTHLERKQWQNLEEFIDDPNFAEIMERDFPREAAVLKQSGMGRRSFIKLMGASLMMGGLSLTGCTPYGRAEQEAIIPYVKMPEEVIQGVPLFFASTMRMGGYATGVVIETHEGRPQRVEGNPNHPASLGGANSWVLASVMELYNPDRLTNVIRSSRVRDTNGATVIENVDSSYEEFQAAFNAINLGTGSEVRLLTERISSPTLAAQIETFLAAYPDAKWYQYEPVARNEVIAGSQLAFGEAVETRYHLGGARVILSLDADFLMNMPGSLVYAREFANGRKVRAGTNTMNRLYAVQSTPNNTGAVADELLRLRASEVAGFTAALAAALGVSGVDAPEGNWDAAWFDALVTDLQANTGAAVVIPGDEQPAEVHALVHAINAALGAVGSTLTYAPSVFVNPVDANAQLAELVDEMNAGSVDVLAILGGNPVYNAPVDIDFASAMERVATSIHLSLYNDETSLLSTWHIPQTHYMEAWGDGLAYDGTASLVQPPINPLYADAHSEYEIMALFNGDARSAYDILRDTWAAGYAGDDFETFWRTALHDGVVAGSTPDPVSPTLQDLSSLDIPTADEGLELIMRVDPSVYDGRFGFNAWLHELPKPLTKITWDNVALMNAATARSLRVNNGDLIRISVGTNEMDVPVWVLDGHADNSMTVSLGYGHGIGGDVESGRSFNAYDVRSTAAPWFTTGVSTLRIGGGYPIAQTQKIFETFGTEPVRHATLEEFMNDPEFAKESYDDPTYLNSFNEPSEWDYEGYAWGMTIDLTSCIGCNACMVACQSENNIPTVGKGEVLQARDMHWLRVDRYDHEDGNGSDFQPVPCMHCENAPCEQVCPVQATVHDHEGINNMVYNRCIGTRSCSANCPYSVRHFNFLDYTGNRPDILIEQMNPDVSVRVRGVMEKCTYCWQRVNAGRITSSKENRRLEDGEVLTACATACPTQAIKFGDINNPDALVTREKAQPHNYSLLAELNTSPRTTYLGRVMNPNTAVNADAEADDAAATETGGE